MNWIKKAKYPIKNQLGTIKHHENLPPGTIELARISDQSSQKIILFLQHEGYLSILRANEKPRRLKNGNLLYTCGQVDFPLGVLTWFDTALTNFCKPPAEGGLHAGAMTSADEDVEGEMLCIQRAMNAGPGVGGYVILNRSRRSRLVFGDEHYDPHRIVFADDLLFEAGLLDLIKNLGEKYRRGEI